MTRSIIDPITRIEGHLRVEMEVDDGVVKDAWVSGGCFRGMELVVQNRTPADAANIVERICGVCPVSHAHASSIATEAALGIKIPNNARIIRNLIEGAQFLHSHILWFYNLAGLDYINPLNALKADPADAQDVATAAGTSTQTDFKALKERLSKFADNKQLSIFSGNWFDSEGGEGYKLPPALDLVCTAHYLEALKMQAKASDIAALLGGKMPHVMTILPGGTSFVPTAQKLDDLKAMVDDLYTWVEATMVPDTLALVPYYKDALKFGKGCGRYIAWGVFEDQSFDMKKRYLPAGVLGDGMSLQDVDGSKIKEGTERSWYEGDTELNPSEGETKPSFTDYDVNDRYTWVKRPTYDGQSMEAGSFSRVLVAYKRNVPFIVKHVNDMLDAIGAPGQLDVLQSTMGRTGVRQIETLYIAGLMKDWVSELIEALQSGDSEYFREPDKQSGQATGYWEAPRGALLHSETIKDGKISNYQIVIPSTWNLAPHDRANNPGPMEEALIGVPVSDIEKPINALRTVHSFDPCTACAVHITEPKTGKSFQTVTSPWGVK
ncbi:MAG: nickel-dependent hydrogenase large subunit [Eggerthellaceae bacterium]|jgi:hydrogenase large subunit|nr:nickel-dependent hydrogenase large subunit [Eggerthellaceae bacterium]MCH4220316.1 nickel-dependent hydrogenase large subunit [Eggerthellaceae bacterium]